jgi:hypothetical protein
MLPLFPHGRVRNQNHALPRFQITNSTPRWRLGVDEATPTVIISSSSV